MNCAHCFWRSLHHRPKNISADISLQFRHRENSIICCVSKINHQLHTAPQIQGQPKPQTTTL